MSEASFPDPPTSPSSPRPPRWLRVLGGLALTLAVLGGVAVWWLGRQLAPVVPAGQGQALELEVLPGWGANEVGEALEEAGLVRNARIFSLYLRAEGLDREIGEGLYTLNPALSTPEIAERLATGGRPRVVTVVIPEGFRAAQVAERLAVQGDGDNNDSEALRQLIADPGALRAPFIPVGAGLEGYLFPASYDLPLRSTPEGILRTMLNRFETELTPETRANLSALELSVHEWVTLASMIQAEAGSYDEMPLIAGVFLNRLELGMPLQSDPTVAYGLNKRLPELSAPNGDLRRDHPWNTYTRTGLPVGPIGNPGHHALQVVFNAQRTDETGEPYLFFLHGLGGEFRPNLTLDDHNRDIERFLR